MSRSRLLTVIFSVAAVAPFFAFAQEINTIRGLAVRLVDILNILMPFFIWLAVFIVVVGIVRYIAAGGNEEKRREGGAFILWGIVSVFILLSIWGLVNLLLNTFPFKNTLPKDKIPFVPRFDTTKPFGG